MRWYALFAIFAACIAPSGAAATLSGSPEPVKVCDGSGLGVITVIWNASDTNATGIEVHVGSPTGVLFAAGDVQGSFPTGKWTANDTLFFLVDDKSKQVLAQYTAKVTSAGCPPPEPKGFWKRLFGK